MPRARKPASRISKRARRRTRTSGSHEAAPTRSLGGGRIPRKDAFGDWAVGDDGRVTCWRTAKDTAEDLEITTRRLQQLEALGMPSRGYRGTCRYPWPHSMEWFIAYRIQLAQGKRPAQIDIADVPADARDIQNAIENAEIENRMRRDPEFRRKCWPQSGVGRCAATSLRIVAGYPVTVPSSAIDRYSALQAATPQAPDAPRRRFCLPLAQRTARLSARLFLAWEIHSGARPDAAAGYRCCSFCPRAASVRRDCGRARSTRRPPDRSRGDPARAPHDGVRANGHRRDANASRSQVGGVDVRTARRPAGRLSLST